MCVMQYENQYYCEVIYEEFHIRNCLNCVHNCEDHSSLDQCYCYAKHALSIWVQPKYFSQFMFLFLPSMIVNLVVPSPCETALIKLGY